MLNNIIIGLLMGMCYALGALITLSLVILLYNLLSRAWDLVLDWRLKTKRV